MKRPLLHLPHFDPLDLQTAAELAAAAVALALFMHWMMLWPQ